MNAKRIDALKQYLKSVEGQYKLGIATEHTYRGALQVLLEALSSGCTVTNEPQQIKCGAPDYVVQRSGIPVGYIEAKDIGKNLDAVEKTEQMARYLDALENLILTDYFEFRFYRNGERVLSVKLIESWKGKLSLIESSLDSFIAALDGFFSYQGQTIKTASTLSRKMALKAKQLARVVHATLETDEEGSTTLQKQYEAFKVVLIEDLDKARFSDVYAQTIAYGLFAARLNDQSPDTFSRDEARNLIPRSNPFLRNLFDSISGAALDEELVWIVEDLVSLFRVANISSVLETLSTPSATQDPFISFYESFLAEYDPSLRKQAGVYYTPKPVVDYIVRSVHEILQDHFALADGLLSVDKITVKEKDSSANRSGKQKEIKREVHRVQVLDPACGTFAFPSAIIELIHKNFASQAGAWSSYVEEDLVPRLHGFEILMAPYAVSHVKLDLILRSTGYVPTGLRKNRRYGIYLTNTLEQAHEDNRNLFKTWLTDEAEAADQIKRDCPIFVLIGNPPYNGTSVNSGEWITDLLGDYKKEPGTNNPLQERNPKWINDDYVKFIRYGQHLIEKNGEGVLAFINPHGYLDAPTFRGVRWCLLNAFDEIYVLNLHGNANRGEVCPDGSPDENVFDILQGVCVNIFVKRKSKKGGLAKVRYCDLYGKRSHKYQWLNENSITTTKWVEASPIAPQYFMVPRDNDLLDEYQAGIKLSDLFLVNVMGFQSHRDKFAVAYTENEMKRRLDLMRSPEIADEDLRETFKLKDTRDWKLSEARARLRMQPDNTYLTKCSYRPFDVRWCYLDQVMMDYPRREIVDNVLNRKNLCLLVPRQQSTEGFRHAWITDLPATDCLISTASREANQVFPLWLYGNAELEERRANISIEECRKLLSPAGLSLAMERSGIEHELAENEVTPEQVMHYVYGVLNSASYRNRYSAFTKSDYPYIPIPKSKRCFDALSQKGRELASLHLQEAKPSLTQITTCFPESGTNEVKKYVFDAGRIYINETQYFGGVSEAVWDYKAGGHQVAHLWLKSRKGMVLSSADILAYQQALLAIERTVAVMTEADEIYAQEFGGTP